MKKIFILALVLCTSGVFAVDRVVEEFGIAPAYSSISAAVAAAEDGDRIIIKNRAGDIPWIEDISINKSLEFHSYQDNGFFVVQGQYNIIKADGRTVTIVGMQNTVGNISVAGGSAPSGSVTVNIMDSNLKNGYIYLQDNAIKGNIVGNTIEDGYAHIALGNIIGNEIDASQSASTAASVASGLSFQGDTALIIGNVLIAESSSSYYGIRASTNAQIVHIKNNYITYGGSGILCEDGNTNSIQNLVWNNTLRNVSGSTFTYGLRLSSTNTNSIWEVMNNVFVRESTATARGVYDGGSNNGQINVYYNHIGAGFSTPISPDFTFIGNNTINETLTVNADGTFNDADEAIDGGNPAPVFYDLDLSPGDPGAYGGSFTLNNFHPLHTGAARVYYVNFPFNVRVGSTLDVKAYSFDR